MTEKTQDQQPQQPKEVLIDGRYYDTTGFRHPGGSILKYFTGTGDASEPFAEFHIRSKKAKKMLSTLPNRPATFNAKDDPQVIEHQKKLSANYMRFREDLIKEGWYEPSIPHVTYRITEILVMFAVSAFVLTRYGGIFTLPALFTIGIATGRCGWAMHEGGHYSLTGNTTVDLRLQEFLYGAGCAMSASWWRSQHNKHHTAPQKLNHDVDLNTLPLVAYNKLVAIKGKNSPFIRFWIPLQKYLFHPVTCLLVATFWHLYLHPKHMMRQHRYFEMFSCLFRYVTYAVLGYVAGATLGQTVAAWLISDFFGSIYIFGNFALSHTHLPVLDADKHAHWAEYGANYTINITPTPLVDWWMGYLNYQIEHHLFPCMPQYRFVTLNPKVRQFFAENGLRYDCRGYIEATMDTINNLDEVAHTFDDMPKPQPAK